VSDRLLPQTTPHPFAVRKDGPPGLVVRKRERAESLHQFLNERLGSAGGDARVAIHQRALVQDRLG